MKIILHCFLIDKYETAWFSMLSEMKYYINTTDSSILNVFSFEFLYSIKSWLISQFAIQSSDNEDFFQDHIQFCQAVLNIMNLVQTQMIIIFDQCHIFSELKNHVFINVMWSEFDKKRYQISNSSKLFLLKEESFSIKQKMSNLIYKLKLSASWKIYSIISVIHLE